MKLNMFSLQNNLKLSADILMGTTALVVAVEWAPVILGIPAAIYACLKIYEWFVDRRKK